MKGQRREIRNAAESAGRPNIWFHDLLQEWATRFLEKGGTIPDLMEAGGWKSISMIQRDIKASKERIRAIQERRS